jgi:hypothetical protein
MNRLKRSMHVCMLAIVLTTLLLAAEGARAAELSSCSWKVVSSPSPGSGGNFLSGVAAVSANNAWAVGYSFNSGGIPQTLIEHWNGTSWKVIPSPNVDSFSNFLSGVGAVSAHDVWAVGYYLNSIGTDITLIEHWDGTSWKVIPNPNAGGSGALSGVAVVSASDVWAVGSSSSQTLTEHWNGTSWKVVSSPNVGSHDNFLNGVAQIPSSSNVWAVGYYMSSSSSRTLTEFYC